MTDMIHGESWEYLAELLEKRETDAVVAYLDSLAPQDVARALSRMNEALRSELFATIPPERAANLLEELSHTQGADVLEELSPETAAAIVEEMESDARADKLASIGEANAEAILAAMDPKEAKDTRNLLSYAPDTAGGIMITEYLSYLMERTIADVLEHLRAHAEEYADFGVQYVYVVDRNRVLKGVIRLRDLVIRPGHTPLIEIMIPDPVSVLSDMPLRELEALFDRYNYIGLPVTDSQKRLVGIVLRDDVEKAHGEEADRTFLRFSGIIGGEEFRHMPLALRSMRRLAFLTPNILLNLVAVSVIAYFDKTLQAVIALAVFMPIISDMSGCSGSQSVAVSIRELGLGLIKPRDYLMIVRKESQLALINGIVLGAIVGLLAGGYGFFFVDFNHHLGPLFLGGVIGGALAINTMNGAVVGGLIPLFLKWLGIDPALAAAPILTTITDMCGFFLVLGMASGALHYLT